MIDHLPTSTCLRKGQKKYKVIIRTLLRKTVVKKQLCIQNLPTFQFDSKNHAKKVGCLLFCYSMIGRHFWLFVATKQKCKQFFVFRIMIATWGPIRYCIIKILTLLDPTHPVCNQILLIKQKNLMLLCNHLA